VTHGPLVALVSVGLLLAAAPLFGQAARPARLMDQPPFDVLTLDKANDNAVLKIHPVPLPGRKVPEKPKASDKLRVRLLDTGEEYEVAWSNVARLDLYEQMVVAEANKLAAEGKFDEAYEVLVFLRSRYPQTPGLAEARQNYLYLSAGAAFRQQKYDEALAILEELLALNPNYRGAAGSPPLLTVLGNIVDPLIARYIEQKDYRAARTLLERVARQHKAENEPFAKKWRETLAALAARYRDEARQHLEAGRLAEAHDAAQAMQQVWPGLEGAEQLVAELARRYPRVVVGVDHPARAADGRSLHDSAARRVGRLVGRLLVEPVGPGTDAWRYASPVGTLEPGEDGASLMFHLAPDRGLSRSNLVQRLLVEAEPLATGSPLSRLQLVASVRPEGERDVQITLRRPHVLPEALLALPLGESLEGAPSPFAAYTELERSETATRYVANTAYVLRRPGQPAEIVERYFEDPQEAIRALQQGEIQVLERVFPGDIAALAADSNLRVAAYQPPTTHVLAVRSSNPFLASRTFRRALLYGSNRELILAQGLLRGKPLPGFRLVSGPFPAPSPAGELPTYGYDRQLEPRPYDPRLGLTLRLLAEGELKLSYKKQQRPPPKLEPLLLGHPADEVSRIACRGLARQWKQIGIECKLVEFPPGVFADDSGKCDLVYLQLAAWEPMVDAGRLLGPGGLVPADSPFLQLTLRQIDEARNWQQARERLLQLHRLVHEEVAVLPLWQTIEHVAYRRDVQGVVPGRLQLYQEVEQWQPQLQLAEARP
jgi:tetratricopeptide (TPR) repeat protein